MEIAEALAEDVGARAACDGLAISRASYYRWKDKSEKPERKYTPPLALSSKERDKVLDMLHSRQFVDMAPQEVYYALLDDGSYLCSIRTMYRLLEACDEVRERRDQLIHPSYTKPELLAEGPNQVWSWDITKLKGPSRYVVGWMVASREKGGLAKKLIELSAKKQEIEPEQLVIHSDRGSSMTSKPVAFLLADLGVTKSLSRPYTSSDNPYSEAHFKTLKYRPEFPKRFGCFQDSRSFCYSFFNWYNCSHYHSGIGFLTPEDAHYGRTEEIIKKRQAVLTEAFAKHPERFKGKMPKPIALPEAVWINKPLSNNDD